MLGNYREESLEGVPKMLAKSIEPKTSWNSSIKKKKRPHGTHKVLGITRPTLWEWDINTQRKHFQFYTLEWCLTTQKAGLV